MGSAFSVNTLDLFSEPVHFSFKKKTYFKTTCGGLVSIIQVTMLLLYLYYLIDELIKREVPIIVDSQTIFENPSNISFSKDENFADTSVRFNYTNKNLIFYNAFGIYKNGLGIYIPLTNEFKKYFDLEIQRTEIDEKGNVKRSSVNFEPCRKFADYSEKFVSLGMNRMYCLNDDFELQGTVNQRSSKCVDVKFKRCNNSTANAQGIICYSDSEIKFFAKDIQFEWYFDNSILNTTSIEIEKVRTNSIEQRYWDILSDYTKKCTIPLGLDKIKLYNSYIPDFLFSVYTEIETFAIREFITEIRDVDFEGNFLKITFARSDLQFVYERRYLDVFSQMATLGGMCDVLFLIGFVFVWHISREKFNEELVNTFYNISDPDVKGDKSQLAKLKELGFDTRYVNNNANNNNNNSHYDKNNNEKNACNDFDEYVRILYNLHRHQAMKKFYMNFVNEEGKNAYAGAANNIERKNTNNAEREKDKKQMLELYETGAKLFDSGSHLLSSSEYLYIENFFNIKKIENMFNLPSSSDMLDCMLDFKSMLEAQNDMFYNLETEKNKNLKNFDNHINENSFLKENKSAAQNVELRILNNNNNIVSDKISKSNKKENLITVGVEKKTELKISEKNRKLQDFEKRKTIASFFQDKLSIDYFQILLNFEKNENYLKLKILFDALKLNNDKMQLSRTDFAKYLLDCTSYELENNNDIEKFKRKKKLLLFHVAKQKLKIDFDIVNILKTIDQFNDFKEIIMDEDQSKLFDFAIKKISNKEFEKTSSNENSGKSSALADKKIDSKILEEEDEFLFENAEEYEEKMNFIRQTEEGLDEIFRECLETGLSLNHVNLLNCIGINPELIKEFEELRYPNNNEKETKRDVNVNKAGNNFKNSDENKLDEINIFEEINEKFGDNQIN